MSSTPTDSTDSTDKRGGLASCPLCQKAAGLWAPAMDWLDDRTGARFAVRRFADRPARRGVPWDRLWPSMIGFTFVVQLTTGFFLWMFYSPSAQTAWESVYYLQNEVTGGWLLRGVHHYAAQVLVALVGLYLVYLVVRGLYRAPREGVYWVAVLMGLCSLGLCLTGDLLAWDQNSYASTLVRVKFAMLLPWIGDDLFKLVAGGPTFGHLTLTRFLTLHIGLLSTGFLGLLVLHAWLAHRADRKDPAVRQKPGSTFWPDGLVYHACSWLLVMVVVGLLVGHVFSGGHGEAGVALGAPADPDPANFYAAARPEWSFRGLYQLSNLFPGDAIPLVGVSWKIVPIFVVTGTLVLVVLAFPFIGRLKSGYWINVGILAFVLAALVWLSAASWAHDFGDAQYQADLAAGETDAERVKELARSPSGIPIRGALSLLRNDPKTQGPILYEKQCVICHNYGAPGDEVIAADPSSAPDLYGFAGRPWVAGLLDPEKVGGPQYYGNTKFATGTMVRYVEGPFAELEEAEQEAIVAALSAEAGLASQNAADQSDAALLEEGRGLIVRECTRCHRYREEGEIGPAPVLTDYGSQEWIVGILADPTHHWFYGARNDRMPVYLEAPAEPAKNHLSANQVQLVANWLRGEWYEPKASGDGAEADPPAMLTVGKWTARRAEQVAPPKTDLAQARMLFQREHCAICHDLTGAPGGDLAADDPSAPDLGGFASREWIAGLLDPDQIRTRKYFGNSKFRGSDMANFVDDMLSNLDEEEQKEIESLAIALSAEARLPSQREMDEMDERDAERIEEGREAFDYWGCFDCHRFHDEGDFVGPDLTGYGSAEWLTAFVCDPTAGASSPAEQLRFYGDENWGMPSYRTFRPETVEGDSPEALEARKELEAKEDLNLLSAGELRLVVELIRGELSE